MSRQLAVTNFCVSNKLLSKFNKVLHSKMLLLSKHIGAARCVLIFRQSQSKCYFFQLILCFVVLIEGVGGWGGIQCIDNFTLPKSFRDYYFDHTFKN